MATGILKSEQVFLLVTDFLSEEKSRHLMDLPEEGKLSCISAGKNRMPGKGLGTKKHTGGTEKKPIPIGINKNCGFCAKTLYFTHLDEIYCNLASLTCKEKRLTCNEMNLIGGFIVRI